MDPYRVVTVDPFSNDLLFLFSQVDFKGLENPAAAVSLTTPWKGE